MLGTHTQTSVYARHVKISRRVGLQLGRKEAHAHAVETCIYTLTVNGRDLCRGIAQGQAGGTSTEQCPAGRGHKH